MELKIYNRVQKIFNYETPKVYSRCTQFKSDTLGLNVS